MEGKVDEAETLEREAIGYRRSGVPESHPHFEDLGAYVRRLVHLLMLKRRVADAEHVFAEFVTPAFEGRPEFPDVLLAKGEFLARCGRWREAESDLVRDLGRKPDDDRPWIALASLLVAQRQGEAYAEHCHKSLERFGNTTDPLVAHQMAKACLILPSLPADLETIARMAEASLIAVSNKWTWPGLVSAKALTYRGGWLPNPADWTAPSLISVAGLAAYRHGRFPSAIEYSEEALRRLAGPSRPAVLPVPWLRAETCAVLAMARWKLQETDSARGALKTCQEIVSAEMPQADSGDFGEDWSDWVIAHALVGEASGLIEGSAPHRVVQTRAELSDGPQPAANKTQSKSE